MFNDNDNSNNHTRFTSAITSSPRIEEIEDIRNLPSERELSINSPDKIINNKDSGYNDFKISL